MRGLFQRPGKLVGTGCGLIAASDPLQAGDGLVHVHPTDQPGHALGVAAAAADELYIFHNIVFYVYPDQLGADAVWSEIHVVPPENKYVWDSSCKDYTRLDKRWQIRSSCGRIREDIKERTDKDMIGIIGAMEEEVQALKEAMTIEEIREKASMTFCRGTLQDREVVVVRSGVGKVNAGICAQILIDDFGADTLINTGIAGSLDARIDIGDIVISTEALHHDMDASIFGDPVGQVPRMDVLAFPADPDLAKKARQANEAANPDIHTFLGRVVSGDQFISSHEAKERISSLFHPLCTEMEGAGIAQAAYLNKVSYVIIRAISDKADNSAQMDYPEFERQAIAHSVRLVKELLERM